MQKVELKYTDDEIFEFIKDAGQGGRWFNTADVIRAAGYHPSFRVKHGGNAAKAAGITGLKIHAILRKRCHFERWAGTRAFYRLTEANG